MRHIMCQRDHFIFCVWVEVHGISVGAIQVSYIKPLRYFGFWLRWLSCKNRQSETVETDS
jgi:hypothetical protein